MYNIIDATRDDGLRVAIKRVERKSEEVEIAKFLSSPTLRCNPLNHCIPILDVFPDPVKPGRTYIVMPILRPFDDPTFAYVGEVADFVGQTLDVGFLVPGSLVYDVTHVFPGPIVYARAAGGASVSLTYSLEGVSC